MAKGEEPFALDKAKKIFTTYQDAAAKMPALFPDNSKTGGDTKALPAIWENKADFTAHSTKLAQDAQAALTTVRDEATFKTELPKVLQNCDACHDKYRRRT
jgi:cytochrome c556